MPERLRAKAYVFEGVPECCSRCEAATGSIQLELPGSATARHVRPHPNCDCWVHLIWAEAEVRVDDWDAITFPDLTPQKNSFTVPNCRRGAGRRLAPDGTVLPLNKRIHISEFGDKHGMPAPVAAHILSEWSPSRGDRTSALIPVQEGTIVEACVQLQYQFTKIECDLTYTFYRTDTGDRLGEIKRREKFGFFAVFDIEVLDAETMVRPCEIALEWA